MDYSTPNAVSVSFCVVAFSVRLNDLSSNNHSSGPRPPPQNMRKLRHL
jgi:hypothetical protein